MYVYLIGHLVSVGPLIKQPNEDDGSLTPIKSVQGSLSATQLPSASNATGAKEEQQLYSMSAGTAKELDKDNATNKVCEITSKLLFYNFTILTRVCLQH